MKVSVCLCLALVCAIFVVANASRYPHSTLHRFFHERMDGNHDGRVSVSEIVKYLHNMDDDMEVEDEALFALLRRIDTNGDQEWSWEEFRAAHKELESESQPPSNGASPKQTHIALTGVKGEMMIMWTTDDTTTTSTVQYGSSDKYGETTTGDYHTYTSGGWKGFIHKVKLTNLTAGAVYHYRVGDTASNEWSDDYTFKTEPAQPGKAVFGAYGDMGTTIPEGFLVARQITEGMDKFELDLVLHNGDLAYASTAMPAPTPSGAYVADPAGGEWEWVWDLFADQISPFARHVPYICGVGNHERFYNFSSYLARFKMPDPWGPVAYNDSDVGAKFWFSFDYGYTHFLLMSTEHDYSPGSEQYEFILNDLQQAENNRERVPWIVVTGHRPMYSSDVTEYDSHQPGAGFQKTIDPLFEKFRVDYYLSGHMHTYERVHPNWNGVTQYAGTPTTNQQYINPNGTLHVMQGSAGVFEDHKWVEPTPAWSATRISLFGYGRLTVHNQTHSQYEFEHTDNREIVDNFWFIKNV